MRSVIVSSRQAQLPEHLKFEIKYEAHPSTALLPKNTQREILPWRIYNRHIKWPTQMISWGWPGGFFFFFF